MAVLALCVAAVAGCRSTPKREYVSATHRFGIDVPEGWEVEEIDGDVVLAILGPRPKAKEGKSVRHHQRPVVHVLAILRWDYDLARWVSETKEVNKLQYRDIKIMRDEEVSMANLPAARVLEFTEHTVGGERRQMQLLVTIGGRAYALLATAMASDFENFEPQFSRCFDSFIVW
ncbi:MAG: hypothetical protein QGD94_08730 [Planctomycetia bacterium]|nr:hypothetical protein [Planctomycetia bacterium]